KEKQTRFASGGSVLTANHGDGWLNKKRKKIKEPFSPAFEYKTTSSSSQTATPSVLPFSFSLSSVSHLSFFKLLQRLVEKM
ncbi:hypothetical protein NQ358_24640, partial [Escherichia coli]|nr:hypothetical protein [Escherichia coli]